MKYWIFKLFLQKVEPIHAKIKSGAEEERDCNILETVINLTFDILKDSLEMHAIEEDLENVFFMMEK